MSRSDCLDARLQDYVDHHSYKLVERIQELVQTPSENTPPDGSEAACQEKIAHHLKAIGLQPQLYELTEVKGLLEHPDFWPGRHYKGRPNLGVRMTGSGGGRSLILSGHIDTVPRGMQEWTREPFGGEIQGNRLYGRGSNDMKGGIGTNLFVLEALHELGIKLQGDLIFESVVDEEFGGANGTLAGRLQGYHADAAILSEASFLRICPAQRGGRTVHITLRASGGILSEGDFPSGTIDQLRYLLQKVPEFSQLRRNICPKERFFGTHPDPVPVTITKVNTGPWGFGEPITVPEICRVELYWQTLPGETQEEIERQFIDWFAAIQKEASELFPIPPQLEFPIRWLPGSAISVDEPLVRELSDSVALTLGKAPEIAGLEGPCDMYIFHRFGIPTVFWGARGGNTHAADEYLEIDSAIAAAKALLLFVCRWCGIAP